MLSQRNGVLGNDLTDLALNPEDLIPTWAERPVASQGTSGATRLYGVISWCSSLKVGQHWVTSGVSLLLTAVKMHGGIHL